MAMIKCKECGSDISSKAESCPKCGFKLKAQPAGCATAFINLVSAIIGILVFIWIIGSFSSGEVSRDPLKELETRCRDFSNAIPTVAARSSAYSSCISSGKDAFRSRGIN